MVNSIWVRRRGRAVCTCSKAGRHTQALSLSLSFSLSLTHTLHVPPATQMHAHARARTQDCSWHCSLALPRPPMHVMGCRHPRHARILASHALSLARVWLLRVTQQASRWMPGCSSLPLISVQQQVPREFLESACILHLQWGLTAGKSSYAGASVCCGLGEYAATGDTECTSCPAGNTCFILL